MPREFRRVSSSAGLVFFLASVAVISTFSFKDRVVAQSETIPEQANECGKDTVSRQDIFASSRCETTKGKGNDCSDCKFVAGENGPCGCLEIHHSECWYYSCNCCVAFKDPAMRK